MALWESRRDFKDAKVRGTKTDIPYRWCSKAIIEYMYVSCMNACTHHYTPHIVACYNISPLKESIKPLILSNYLIRPSHFPLSNPTQVTNGSGVEPLRNENEVTLLVQALAIESSPSRVITHVELAVICSTIFHIRVLLLVGQPGSNIE